MDLKQAHSQFLNLELNWLIKVINERMQSHFKRGADDQATLEIPCPEIDGLDCTYTQIINHYQFGWAERLVLILAQTAHLAPQMLDTFFVVNPLFNRPYTEFGGLIGKRHRGFLPTVETALFLLAGKNLAQRLALQSFFKADHPFQSFRILEIDTSGNNESDWSSPLCLSEEYKNYLSYNRSYEPHYNAHFPAAKIETPLSWDDLILEKSIKEELVKISTWIQHQDTILNEWGFNHHLKPGYRVLFYGPPGTGKSLSAVLLGKITGLEVYRIDLSQIVSKYIGETEKNLSRIFDIAIHKNWILFFDEADALFGRRTAAKDSKDRYANQETAYLLQRIEDFPGVIVLASNLKMNIDQAFSRRFQSILHFPMPNAQQRLQLWQNIFSAHPILDESVQLEPLAIRYELSGEAISNILRHASIIASSRTNKMVNQKDLEIAVRRELTKP